MAALPVHAGVQAGAQGGGTRSGCGSARSSPPEAASQQCGAGHGSTAHRTSKRRECVHPGEEQALSDGASIWWRVGLEVRRGCYSAACCHQLPTALERLQQALPLPLPLLLPMLLPPPLLLLVVVVDWWWWRHSLATEMVPAGHRVQAAAPRLLQPVPYNSMQPKHTADPAAAA
jgi:hypothetical protein